MWIMLTWMTWVCVATVVVVVVLLVFIFKTVVIGTVQDDTLFATEALGVLVVGL